MRLTTFIPGGALTCGRMKVYCESLAAIRRHKFRYAKCAWITFIPGGALTCGRMKVTVAVNVLWLSENFTEDRR